jgi:hypothetical protein
MTPSDQTDTNIGAGQKQIASIRPPPIVLRLPQQGPLQPRHRRQSPTPSVGPGTATYPRPGATSTGTCWWVRTAPTRWSPRTTMRRVIPTAARFVSSTLVGGRTASVTLVTATNLSPRRSDGLSISQTALRPEPVNILQLVVRMGVSGTTTLNRREMPHANLRRGGVRIYARWMAATDALETNCATKLRWWTASASGTVRCSLKRNSVAVAAPLGWGLTA